MGFFRILLIILTFGILGKKKSAEDVYLRRKMEIKSEKLAEKELEQQGKRLEQRRQQLLKTKKWLLCYFF